MKICAWKNKTHFQALFFVCLALTAATTSWSQGDAAEFRVAAIISAGERSRALVESADGVQIWYQVGDYLDELRISEISDDGITLLTPDGEVLLDLRGDRKRVSTPLAEMPSVPASEQSRSYQYLGVLSQIEAATPMQGESQERAVSRTMNKVLGLADQARITAVGRVQVKTAAEARNELRQRLNGADPIRITVEDDPTTVLYVVPDQ